MVLGKLNSYMQKNEMGPFCYTTYKNKLKRINDLNAKPDTIKLIE